MVEMKDMGNVLHLYFITVHGLKWIARKQSSFFFSTKNCLFQTVFLVILYSILEIARHISYCNDMYLLIFLHQTVNNTIIFDK